MKLVYGIICRLRKTTRYLLRLFIIKFHSYIRALGGGGVGEDLIKIGRDAGPWKKSEF